MSLISDSISVVNKSYSTQYSNYSKEWRQMGAISKASNIISLCSGIKAENMLDVGSGDGSVLSYLVQKNFISDICAVDVSESALALLKARNLFEVKEVKHFDGYNIPYDDKQFDLVTCSHVMEHVEHPRLVLREIARVSRYQFFEIPIDFSFFVDQKLRHFLSYGHINIFTPALFKFLIKSEGFEVIKEDYRFYSRESLKQSFPDQHTRLINTLKNKIISSIPVLKKIKPNIYTVLCKKGTKGLEIL